MRFDLKWVNHWFGLWDVDGIQIRTGIVKPDFMLEDSDGTYFGSSGVIVIKSSLPPDIFSLSLLHELYHAYFHLREIGNVSVLKPDEDQKVSEEQIVSRMSACTYSLMKSNPKLFQEYIFPGTKVKKLLGLK